MSRRNAAGQETLRRAMQRPTCQKREEEWHETGQRAVPTAKLHLRPRRILDVNS